MNSYKIHATSDKQPGQVVPYLLLTADETGRARIDLSDLGAGPGPVFTLSLDALYQVLEGKPLASSLDDPMFLMCADGDELVLEYRDGSGAEARQTRVWLAEFALAWNMLSGFGRHTGTLLA